jgi:hypothetical protein
MGLFDLIPTQQQQPSFASGNWGNPGMTNYAAPLMAAAGYGPTVGQPQLPSAQEATNRQAPPAVPAPSSSMPLTVSTPGAMQVPQQQQQQQQQQTQPQQAQPWWAQFLGGR